MSRLRHPAPALIPGMNAIAFTRGSAQLRASRRMAASLVLTPSFETLASQAPQDEVGGMEHHQ